jgi:ABC-type branched-subunit amino acid transport system ATPase component/predicted MFS family arabinose efflux permease
MRLRQRLDALTGGAPATPLVVLFALNLVDELDQIAFGILAPEIGETFQIADKTVILLSTLVAVFVLVAALPASVIGDRVNRVRLVTFAALAWASMSVLTGFAGMVGLLAVLVIARFFAGIGRVINEPVHSSLLADYYKPEQLPGIFAVHRFANPLSRVTAVAIGAAALYISWQTLFIVLAVPTAIFILAMAKLREPLRGETIDPELAAQQADGPAIGFAEARRQLFGIRSLRRLYIGAGLLGFGLLPLGGFIAFFFEDVYGFSTFQRGITTFVYGAGSTLGLVVGQRLASKVEPGSRELATLTGYSFGAGGIGLLLMALAPWAPVSVALLFISGVGFGAYIPAYFPLLSVIVPPRVRTQAYGYSLIIIGVGGVCGAVLMGGLGESQGYRLGIGVTATIIASSGLIAMSAGRFVSRDREQAERSMRAAQELREATAAGSGALLSCRGRRGGLRPGPGALRGRHGRAPRRDRRPARHERCRQVDPAQGHQRLGRRHRRLRSFDGADITHTDAHHRKAGIVQVPGGKAVFPTLTVAEHLRAAGWLYRDDPEYLKRAIEEVSRSSPACGSATTQMAGNLSGGEQQMLALGMAFIAKPKLLMIDELSLGLAPTIVEQLLGIVRTIQESGTAIILVEQSINVALTVAERAYFLEKGEVRFEGATAELLERDDIVRSVFLEGAGRPRATRPRSRSPPPEEGLGRRPR